MLPPWKEIFVSDNERYESFEIAVEINHHLKKHTKKLDMKLLQFLLVQLKKEQILF